MSEQQQLNGTTSSSSAGATAAVTNGLAGGCDWRAGDLVKFMELVGNLKVSSGGGGEMKNCSQLTIPLTFLFWYSI